MSVRWEEKCDHLKETEMAPRKILRLFREKAEKAKLEKVEMKKDK